MTRLASVLASVPVARPARQMYLRLGGRRIWVWFVPIAVFVVVRREQSRLPLLIAAVVALGFLILLSRHPAAAISTLLVLLIFDTFMLAGLFKLGLPASVVRSLGYWKEGVIAGALIAALRTPRRRKRNALDIMAASYVALGTAYLLLPGFFVGSNVGSALSFSTRELGWRSDVFYVLIFLILRHLRFDRDVVTKILMRVFAVAVIAAVIGIFEFVASGTWNHFAVKTVGVQNYKYVVLHQVPGPTFQLNDIRVYGHLGGHQFVRIGSVLLDYLGVGYIFALGLGVCTELIVRAQARLLVYLSLPLLAVALMLTQTRSAIIAGAVAVLIALRAQIGRTIAHRLRLAMLIGGGVIVLFPVALTTGALHRFSGDTTSDATHTSAFHSGVHAMAKAPLGYGLATSAGGGQIAAQRQSTQSGATTNPILVTESQYLQIGVELGDIGLAVYVLTILLLIRHLLRRPANDRAPPLAPSAIANALIGTAIGGLFLQTYTGLQVAWIYWGLAGLAAGLIDRDLDEPDRDHELIRQAATQSKPGLPLVSGPHALT